MRIRPMVAALVSATLALSACGTARPSAAERAAERRVESGLLSAGALPAGWSIAATQAAAGGGRTAAGYCGLQQAEERDTLAVALRGFVDGRSTYLIESVAAYPDAGDPTRLLGTIHDKLIGCRALTQSGHTLLPHPLRYPAVAGAGHVAAYTASGSVGSNYIAVTFVYAVRGDELISLLYGSHAVPAVAQTAGFARRAVAQA